jgi:TRAP-type C4-dicarboxylate transport system permease small subunit
MIGAVVATRKGKHIAVDMASFLLPDFLKPWMSIVIHIFSLLVSSVLTWASIVFVRNEAIMGGETFLALPSWAWGLVFPVSFALITYHFGVATVEDALQLAGKASHKKKRES